ncbi:MAG TPA: N-acetylmuramoyl-L-alanine amidase [Trichocoleus sp.]|jgi:hypothetical protein
MGRIFVAAGDGETADCRIAPIGAVDRTTAAQETALLRDRIVQMLKSGGYEALAVPDGLSVSQAIDWINYRCRAGDVALSLQIVSTAASKTRGATAFYSANNDQRRAQAERILQLYLLRVPQLLNRGAKPDTFTALGRLAFCRQVIIPSLQLEAGDFSHADDRQIFQKQPQEVALGIAEGLAAWGRAMVPSQTPRPYPAVALQVNGAPYDEPGIMIEGNAYVPADLIDQFGIELPLSSAVRRVEYQNVVYVQAIDLRDYHLALDWDNANQTLNLRSTLLLAPHQLERIMGRGTTSDVQLMMFLKSCNADSLAQFPELTKLYREEAAIEGVNHDIAFAQMCLETDFLQFLPDLKPEHNNFGGLGAISSDGLAHFSSARIGIRAQIQHLKAYATTEPLVQALVDPRFHCVRRGIAPTVTLLSGRWSAAADYGDRILAIAKRLYEFTDYL